MLSGTDQPLRFHMMRASNRVTHICAAVSIALLVGACGSSSSGGRASTGGASSSGAAATSSTASAPSGDSSSTVAIITVPGYGKVLGTGAGKALYMLTADPSNSSKCDSTCASVWPPLTVTGKPTAGNGISSSMLSEFKRSDGKEQVSYNGHPLYTYTGPTAASGEGLASYGGIWYLLDANGKPVKKTLGNGAY